MCLLHQLFTDGTTNKLMGCYMEEHPDDVVLVRVYGNKTELFVDRDNELKSFQVLHANGCAPSLYCSFQNGICYEFMQGRALDTQDVRDPVLLRWVPFSTRHEIEGFKRAIFLKIT